MKYLVSLLLCTSLAACVTAPPEPMVKPQTLFNDALFAPPSDKIDPAEVFAFDNNMQDFLDHEVSHRAFMVGRVGALYEGLYGKDPKHFGYNALQTRTAGDVFRSRSGNCLSYTIMTAAFAKRMGLPVQFHQVDMGEVWDRNNNIEYRIGHVNLTVGENSVTSPDSAKLFDFVNPEEASNGMQEDIGEDVIVAMYMNNRAAEALAKNDVDNAYWWARAAIVHTPAFMASYNTLGVVYQRHQNLADAERVFHRILDREADNVLALSNEAQVLEKLGRPAEAKELRGRLVAIQPNPPYYFFNRGIDAMRLSDFKTAKAEFTKEVNRASYNHEFHFWLALANYYLGNMSATREQLEVAMQNSPNDEQRGLYAAKLAKLREMSHQMRQ
jgi:Flp pilus assembly protein TadD